VDETKIMHDIIRPFKATNKGSYDDIDIDFFLNNWEKLAAKTTISPETLPRLAEGVIRLHNLGFICTATFAYIKNPLVPICHMLAYELEAIFSPIDRDFRYCGAG